MSQLNEKPKTYLDRKGLLPNAEFVLISYAHASSGVVYPDLSALYENGLNYWYDTELLSGQVWYQTVEKTLSDEKCCGIIFFFDLNCLVREEALSGEEDCEVTGRGAVEKEIEIFEKLKKQKPNMRAFCVLAAEDESVYSIVRQAFIKCKNLKDSRLKEVLPEERVQTVLKAFNKDKIYVLRQGNYIQDIVDSLRKSNPFCVTDSQSEELAFAEAFAGKSHQQNEYKELDFGEYPQTCLGETSERVEEIRTQSDGSRVLYKGGKKYAFEPLRWVLLDTEGRTATLVCKKTLDFLDGKEETVQNWLQTFDKIAFQDEDRERLVQAPSLPDVATMQAFGGKLKELSVTDLTGKSSVDMVWLADRNGSERKIFCGVIKGEADIDYEYVSSKAGVMPMIKLVY